LVRYLTDRLLNPRVHRTIEQESDEPL
jgi:hypothetical protein